MGTKTTIDFDDYEGQQYDEYQGDDPKPGWYTFELQRVGYTDDSEESLRWIFVIADGPYQGWAGFVFANFDTTKWKNQETLRAVQGGKEQKVSLDWSNEKATAAFVRKAKRVRGKVESYANKETGDIRLSLRKVRPLLEDASTTRVSKADDLSEEVEEVQGTEADVEGDYTEDELGEMNLKELKAILKDEFEYNAKQLRSIKDEDAAIDAILAAQEEAGDDPEAEDDDDTDDDADGDFDDDFDEDATEETEPEPEPEPAPRRRRAAATKAAPAKAAPAKATKAAAPAQRTRRTRRA